MSGAQILYYVLNLNLTKKYPLTIPHRAMSSDDLFDIFFQQRHIKILLHLNRDVFNIY